MDSLSVVLLAVQGYLLHDLRLCRRTNSRHADAHIDCWTNAFIKEVRREEELSVGDGDYVSWDIGRDISFLGFDEWQSRHRSATCPAGHASRRHQQDGLPEQVAFRTADTSLGS